MILIGKLIQKTYSKDKFHLYRFRKNGGKVVSMIFNGENPPKPLKTIEYQVTVTESESAKHGKQYTIVDIERFEKRGYSDRQETAILNDQIKAIG